MEPNWDHLQADPDLKALFSSDALAAKLKEIRLILEDPKGKHATDLHALGRARGFLEAVSFLERLPTTMLKRRGYASGASLPDMGPQVNSPS